MQLAGPAAWMLTRASRAIVCNSDAYAFPVRFSVTEGYDAVSEPEAARRLRYDGAAHNRPQRGNELCFPLFRQRLQLTAEVLYDRGSGISRALWRHQEDALQFRLAVPLTRQYTSLKRVSALAAPKGSVQDVRAATGNQAERV